MTSGDPVLSAEKSKDNQTAKSAEIIDTADASLMPVMFVLLLALAVRIPFLFIVPMVEAPDEFAHFWVTRFLSENLTAPDAQQVIAGGPSAVYGSLPPFGYLPHVFFTKVIPGLDISFTERLGSIVGGMVTVFAGFKLGQILFDKRWMQLALPVCVALHPQFVFVNAYCNSDSTACALASLLLWLSALMIWNGPRIGYAAAAGALSACLALSKFSALAVVPAAFFAVISSCWIFGLSFAQTAIRIGLFCAVGGSLCLPWFARNAAVFNGDWLGANTMRASWAKTFNRSIEPVSLSSVLKQKVWWQQLFCSFWGVFGYQKHYLPVPFYFAYLISIVVSSVGVFTQLSHLLKKKNSAILFLNRSSDDEKIFLKKQAIWLSLLFSVVLSWAGLFYAAAQNLGGPQGRYLFPSEISFMSIVIAGLYGVHAKAGKWLVFTYLALNGLALFYSMFMLFSMFGMRLKPY